VKIILSRKGVDSSSGGFASPVFEDGSMLSIPIPDKRASVRYRDIKCDYPNRSIEKCSVAKLVRDLSNGKLKGSEKAHLDPDLDCNSLERAPKWRALFGQHGAAQSHLKSLNIGAGDVFLFFGWFKQVELYRRRWRYVPGAPDLHIIFGWMQIVSVESASEIKQSEKYNWAHYHPHCLAEFSGCNVIYTARKKLNLPGSKVAGAGIFRQYDERLCLTEKGASRSNWSLPLWMHPQGRDSTLSYHSDIKRWRKETGCVKLKSVARGQEFVLDLEHYPEGVDWLRGLFNQS